ncbi:hypothetical protein ACSBR1_034186 [Camellia fascicularis]
MANAEQEVRVTDNMYSEEEEYVDPNIRGGNNEEEVQEVNLEAKNAASGRNGPMKGNREGYYNESDFQV